MINLNKRRKISTNIKLLVAVNALPGEYIKLLSASQLSRYRNHFDIKEYFGGELTNIHDETIETLKRINAHKLERKIIISFLTLAVTIRGAFTKAKHFHKILSANKDEIVETVQRIQNHISIEKCAKLIGIGISTLRGWISSVRVRCSGSIINLCRKVHSSQLLFRETQQMKTLLQDEKMLHWPLVSVYFHALHQRIVSMSLSTWYKYAGLLNIKRIKPRSIKQYNGSIKAVYPNQYWHADVTLFRTADSMQHYIYLVIDNFSKMILAWAVNTRLSAETRTQTFQDAVKAAVSYDPALTTIDLIVDGGSENNNKTVEEFIQGIETIEINKIRALKDVRYSNAHAEAANRTLKLYYLNQQDILNTAALIAFMEKNIYDLNFTRPHGRINGLIPIDCYTGKAIDKTVIINQLKEARENRVQLNKYQSCHKCLY